MVKHYCDNCGKECEYGRKTWEENTVLQPGNLQVRVFVVVREHPEQAPMKDICRPCALQAAAVVLSLAPTQESP